MDDGFALMRDPALPPDMKDGVAQFQKKRESRRKISNCFLSLAMITSSSVHSATSCLATYDESLALLNPQSVLLNPGFQSRAIPTPGPPLSADFFPNPSATGGRASFLCIQSSQRVQIYEKDGKIKLFEAAIDEIHKNPAPSAGTYAFLDTTKSKPLSRLSTKLHPRNHIMFLGGNGLRFA